MGTRANRRGGAAAAALGTAALLLLALGGCEFFTASAFPDYASGIQSQTSVSEWIDDPDRSHVFMTASMNPLDTYLTLLVENPGGERLVVFLDEDLDTLAAYTEAELQAAVGPGSLGRFTGVDLALRPTVGNFVFTTGFEPLLATSANPDATMVLRFDEEDQTNNRMFGVRADNGTNELFIDYYELDVLSPFPWVFDNVVNQGVLGPSADYEVQGGLALDDEDAVGGDMILLIRDNATADMHVTAFEYADLPPVSGLPPPTVSYIEDPRTPYTFNDVDSYGGWITSGGLVMRDEDDGVYRLYETENGNKIGEYGGLEELDHEAAYPLDEGYFFVLDRRAERLLRLANWW
jgi:hypothetical protein